MKKIILTIILISALLSGCFSSNVADKQIDLKETITNENSQSNSNEVSIDDETSNTTSQIKAYDYFNNYNAEIESEVKNAISEASNLQDELNKIKQIADEYVKASTNANTQSEINSSSIWNYTVWDKELNDLWKRINKSANT